MGTDSFVEDSVTLPEVFDGFAGRFFFGNLSTIGAFLIANTPQLAAGRDILQNGQPPGSALGRKFSTFFSVSFSFFSSFVSASICFFSTSFLHLMASFIVVC